MLIYKKYYERTAESNNIYIWNGEFGGDFEVVEHDIGVRGCKRDRIMLITAGIMQIISLMFLL